MNDFTGIPIQKGYYQILSGLIMCIVFHLFSCNSENAGKKIYPRYSEPSGSGI